jgi:hypothetical protein
VLVEFKFAMAAAHDSSPSQEKVLYCTHSVFTAIIATHGGRGRTRMHESVSACARICLRACVRACVCLRACAWRARAYVSSYGVVVANVFFFVIFIKGWIYFFVFVIVTGQR